MLRYNIAFTFISNVLIGIFTFFTFIVIARLLGPTQTGVVSFILSSLGLFQFIADFGFNSAHVKKISEGNDLILCMGTFLRIKTSLVIVMLISTVLYYFFLFPITNQNILKAYHPYVLLLFIGYFVIIKFSEIFQFSFQAQKKSIQQQTPLVLSGFLRIVLIILFIYLGFGILSVALGYFLSAILLFFSGLFFIKINFPKKFDYTLFKEYFVYALPIAMYTFLISINTNIDKLIIGYTTNISNVGFYFSGEQLTFFFSTITAAFSMLLFPTFSELYSKKKFDTILSIRNKAEKIIALLFIPIILFVILFSDPIITKILGKQYLSTSNIYRLLLILTLFGSLNSIFEQYLISTAYVKTNLKIAFFNITLNILLLFILIPQNIFGVKVLGLGPIGAAVAGIVSYLPRFVLVRYKVYKFSKSSIQKEIILILIAGLIPFIGFAFFVIPSWNISILNLLLYFSLYMLIYSLIVVLFRIISKNDIDGFVNGFKYTFVRRFFVEELKN